MNKILEEKIKADIYRSGFPLELELIEKLRLQDEALVFPNISFQNSDNVIRELDLVAIFQDYSNEWLHGPVGIQLLIECKKCSKHPWVFFEEVSDPLISLGLVHKVDYSTDLNIENPFTILTGCNNTSLSNHYYNDFHIPKSKTYFEALKSSNEPTVIFKAIMNIFHGRKHCKEWFLKKNTKENLRTYLNQYVIVLDGKLILASKNENDFNISEVKHIIVRAIDTLTSPKMDLLGDEIIIDVITKEYFDTYIKLTKNNITFFNNHLKNIEGSGLIKII